MWGPPIRSHGSKYVGGNYNVERIGPEASYTTVQTMCITSRADHVWTIYWAPQMVNSLISCKTPSTWLRDYSQPWLATICS